MLFLSGVQQNPSSRVIWPSEKSLPLTDPLNSHHKKKLRLDDSLSGDYILLKHPLEVRWASRSPLSEPSTLLPSLSICPSFISSTLAPQWPPPLGEGTRERQPLGLWGKLGWGRPQGLLGWRLQVLLSPSLSVSLLCHPLWCLQMKQMKKLLLRFSTVWSVCVCVAGSGQVVDEHTVTMGFHQWLAGVTERIHQTMHYQSDGKLKHWRSIFEQNNEQKNLI